MYQHVFLTDEEYTRLQGDFPDIEKRIQNLDDYLENNPSKHYANHNLTIRKWAADDLDKKQKPQPNAPKKQYSASEVVEMMKAGLI